MNLIHLTRKESEPLRESYERTTVYIVKENTLYYKRISWGRISENYTERIPLTAAEVATIKTLTRN